MTLTLFFCLIADPAICRAIRPSVEGAPLFACVVEAQTLATAWLADHPKWRLDHTECSVGERARGRDA